MYTEVSPICKALKQVARQCEQNAIPISFVPTGGNVFEKNLDQLDSIFVYSQVLKEILLTIRFSEEDIKEYIDYCRTIFIKHQFGGISAIVSYTPCSIVRYG